MKILLGDFSAKVGKDDIFKPTIGNESLYKISNDNVVRIVNFATSKNLIVKSADVSTSQHSYINLTSPDGNIHNQINHNLLGRQRMLPHRNFHNELGCLQMGIPTVRLTSY
jgi:hypothetical protein